jgi:hypothetical protein
VRRVNPNSLPHFRSFDVIGTTAPAISDTRYAARFTVLRDTQHFTLDTEHNFTPKEMAQISQSLIEVAVGNFKSTYDTDELFADLDGE